MILCTRNICELRPTEWTGNIITDSCLFMINFHLRKAYLCCSIQSLLTDDTAKNYSGYSISVLSSTQKTYNIHILPCSYQLHWRCHLNLYHSLGVFSRWQIDDIFLIFPRKQDMTFHANCLLRRQVAWNVISCFLGRIKKHFKMSSAENFTQSAKR